MTSRGVIVNHYDSLSDAFDDHERPFRLLKERGFSDEDIEMIMYDEDVPITYNGIDGTWHESGASVDVIEIIDDSRRMKIVDLPSGAQLVYR